MPPADLDALDQALAALVSDRWWPRVLGCGDCAEHGGEDCRTHGKAARPDGGNDSAQAIAPLRALLAEVRRLREDVAKVTESRDGWHGIACRDAAKLNAAERERDAARLDAGNAESRALAAEAERDRLREAVAAVRAVAESWQPRDSDDMSTELRKGIALGRIRCRDAVLDTLDAAHATAAGKETP